MCTVTVFRQPGSLLVTMNRDENRLRAEEEPPQVRGGDAECSVVWLAPMDTQARGTWMGVNDRGVVACLLNNYLAPVPDTANRSRGEIVPGLMVRGGWKAAVEWIETGFDPKVYPPFLLVVASPDGGWLFEWDGAGRLERKSIDTEWWMLSSSSWNTLEVLEWRKKEFARWLAAECPFEEEVPSFHLHQPQGMAEWAPLMSREATVTRSITQVGVEGRRSRIAMNYWPHPSPAERTAPERVEVDLRREST